MKRALFLVSMATASVLAAAPEPQAPKGPPPGPPPPYQMRAPLPAGDRLVGGKDGAALFSNRCGACHLLGGMGTNLLTKQRMMLGEPPDRREVELIRARTHTGRPIARPGALAKLEVLLGRRLHPLPRGRPPKKTKGDMTQGADSRTRGTQPVRRK